jgi:hypothetical protein
MVSSLDHSSKGNDVKIWLITLVIAGSNILAYGSGWYDGARRGDKFGYTRAVAEEAARQTEHARIMQFIGVCKWAKVMEADERCKTELP